MGYLPQFKNDLFISYRHTSNEGKDKWVDAFYKGLKANLEDLVSKDVKIWNDYQLRGGEEWRPEIAQALDDTAIFLAIVSRTYFDSDECRKELDRFLGRLKDTTRGSQRKIFPIFKQPTKPEQELPPEMGEIHRHDFYHPDPLDPYRFQEFSPSQNEADHDFGAALARVAQDLMVLLEKLKGDARKHMLGKVFIAHVGPELQQEREKLRSDLQQRGYLVIPERGYLWNTADHREKVFSDLEAAQLCIHIIARSASIEPETAAQARLQLELAHEVMKRKARPAPMVWIQPGSEIDASARDLIDYIRNDLANDEVPYLEGGFEDFKTQINTELQKLRPPPASPVCEIAVTVEKPLPLQAPPPPVREIALLIEEGDVGTTAEAEIKDVLVSRLALDPKSVKFAGTSPNDAARLTKTLAKCEQCIIFWGGQPEEWVSDVLDNEALSGLGRGRLCIYAAGPASPEKRSFQTLKARIIRGENGFNETGLRAFCDKASGT